MAIDHDDDNDDDYDDDETMPDEAPRLFLTAIFKICKSSTY